MMCGVSADEVLKLPIRKNSFQSSCERLSNDFPVIKTTFSSPTDPEPEHLPKEIRRCYFEGLPDQAFCAPLGIGKRAHLVCEKSFLSLDPSLISLPEVRICFASASWLEDALWLCVRDGVQHQSELSTKIQYLGRIRELSVRAASSC
jgi:hypothetical protein